MILDNEVTMNRSPPKHRTDPGSAGVRATSRRDRKALRRCLYVFCVAVLFTTPCSGQATEADIKRLGIIKAAFVYNFLDYVVRPEDDEPEVYRVVVLGDSHVAKPLQMISERKKVKGRKIQVLTYPKITAFDTCNVLYISSELAADIDTVRALVEGWTVLIIGESPGLAAKGVAFNIVPDGRTMRFEVNQRALRRVGLTAGSQLLKLATLVDEEDP